MDNFLEQARNQLTSCENPEEILAELNDHIEENRKYYEDIGYFGDACSEKVNEAMGDGDIIGQRLNAQNTRKITGLQILLVVLIVILNFLLSTIFALPFYGNSFVKPFFTGVAILIIDYVFTILAIKLKSKLISFVLILMCFLTLHFSATKLAYPLINILLVNNNSFEIFNKYDLISYASTALILLSVILPNIYNIYYCHRVEKLKNTRRQYYFTKKIIKSLIAFSIITAISAYPLFALNQSLSKRQQEIKNELVEFIYDVSTRFDDTQFSEIEDYVLNSGYDFIETEYEYEEDYNYRTFSCYKGNWELYASFYNDDKSYSLSMSNLICNSAQPYLFFNDYDKELEVRERIGDDESDDKNGACIGMTADEIHSKLQEISFCQFSFNNCVYEHFPENQKFDYHYSWLTSDSLFFVFGRHDYYFYYDENGKCISYDLTLD